MIKQLKQIVTRNDGNGENLISRVAMLYYLKFPVINNNKKIYHKQRNNKYQ